MRKIFFLTIIAAVFVGSAAAQTTPKTVSDFYYLLPEKYFAPYAEEGAKKPELRAYRKSLIKIEDAKNGYLRLEGTAWEGWAEIAIFKKTAGKYVVGISQIGCGPICDSEETFLAYENGNWREITGEVLPEITESQRQAAYKQKKINQDDEPGLVYELPRVGKIIKVRTDGDKNIVLFELTWDGARFILKSK